MSKSNCFCKSENGYSYSTENSSWNENDRMGLFVFTLLLTIIILSCYVLYKWNTFVGNTFSIFITIIFILGCIIIYLIYSRPILLLYIPSSILSYFIKTPPFLNRKQYFPNHDLFEQKKQFESIRNEVDTMLQRTNGGNTLTLTKDSYSGENAYIGSDIKEVDGKKRAWRLLNIKVGNLYTKDALEHFPTLVGILRKVPEVTSCVVSVLEPGIRIPIHVGYYKGIMRYMIPTHIPKDRKNVFLCVNGIKYSWTEGEGVLWDDTFVHKVYNNTDEVRVLIYMDVIRPLDNESISWLNGINKWFINKATGSSIVQEEIKRTERQIPI